MDSANASRSSLLKRRERLLESLPPLAEVMRGSYLRREIRCGKANCRCARGARHVLRCVSVSLPRGRTRQVTVPKEWVTTVKHWIENYRVYWQAIEEVSAINRRLLQLREMPAEVEPERHRRGPER